ncbi:MAG: hypothetical protein ACYDA6_08245 [Solirubrobacteraceae bacterium]
MKSTAHSKPTAPTPKAPTIDPCPDEPSGETALNTETLADGNHTVTLTAEDPAANSATSEAHTIAVDNHGPSAPEAFAAEATNPATFSYHVTWRDPSQADPAPITQTLVRLCARTTGACTAPQEATGTSATVGFPSPGPWSIEVALVDEDGKMSPYATLPIEVPAPPVETTSTTTTTQSTATATTTHTTTTHTTTTTTHTTTTVRLAVAGVQSGGVLTISASVPGARDGARIKLSAHIRHDGHEVQSCTADASVHHGRAEAHFRLSRAADGGDSTVRALYDGHAVRATATRERATRRELRILRRRRMARARAACHEQRRRR